MPGLLYTSMTGELISVLGERTLLVPGIIPTISRNRLKNESENKRMIIRLESYLY